MKILNSIFTIFYLILLFNNITLAEANNDISYDSRFVVENDNSIICSIYENCDGIFKFYNDTLKEIIPKRALKIYIYDNTIYCLEIISGDDYGFMKIDISGESYVSFKKEGMCDYGLIPYGNGFVYIRFDNETFKGELVYYDILNNKTEVISNGEVENFFVYDQSIYYTCNNIKGVYKYEPGKTEIIKVDDYIYNSFIIKDDIMFYNDGINIKKVSYKGGSPIILTSSYNGYGFRIYDDRIYYCKDTDKCKLFMINTNGTDENELMELNPDYEFTVYDEKIYYIDNDRNFCCYSIKDKNNIIIMNGNFTGLTALSDKIYLFKLTDKNAVLYKYDFSDFKIYQIVELDNKSDNTDMINDSDEHQTTDNADIIDKNHDDTINPYNFGVLEWSIIGVSAVVLASGLTYLIFKKKKQ